MSLLSEDAVVQTGEGLRLGRRASEETERVEGRQAECFHIQHLCLRFNYKLSIIICPPLLTCTSHYSNKYPIFYIGIPAEFYEFTAPTLHLGFKYITSLNRIVRMLTDDEIFLCSEFTSKVAPVSQVHKLGGIPKNMERVSYDRLIVCDPNQETKKTRMVQLKLKKKSEDSNQIFICEERVIEQFEGIWTSWDFEQDNYALLINIQGDFLFYNMNSKSIQQAQKQHPGMYTDAQIMHTNQHFITCGGTLKNQKTNAPERIIKVWQVDQSDSLVQKSRINTGHKKAIQHSFLMNKSTVVTLSPDKTVRFVNLTTEQVSSVIQTDVELLSGCQIDYNTILAGGISKNVKVYDVRTRKALNVSPKINENLVHIVNFTRFTDKNVLVSNINNINSIDLRTWELIPLGVYEKGEINSQILTLNSSEFVIGNREKTLQVWKAS